MIPRDASPAAEEGAVNEIPDVYRLSPFRAPMPLFNSAFTIGRAKEYIDLIPDEDDSRIAQTEYCLFTGDAEKAAKLAEPYLISHDPGLRFSANLICSFAFLGCRYGHMEKFAMLNLGRQAEAAVNAEAPGKIQALALFAASIISVDLHLSRAEVLPLDEYLSLLPGGLQAICCCLMAHKAYLEKDYGKCLTIAEISLALSTEMYPVAAVYTHVAAAIALINMQRMEEARAHMDKAWRIAEPDGLLQPFVEHHGLLQRMVEVYFRRTAPDVLPRIMKLTEKYSAGWRKVHNLETGRDVADNLTVTEFTIAMLYSRVWRSREIADHLELSVRTVNRHVSSIYEKLGIHSRDMLEGFKLQ